MKTTNIMDVFNLFNLIAKGGKEQGWQRWWRAASNPHTNYPRRKEGTLTLTIQEGRKEGTLTLTIQEGRKEGTLTLTIQEGRKEGRKEGEEGRRGSYTYHTIRTQEGGQDRTAQKKGRGGGTSVCFTWGWGSWCQRACVWGPPRPRSPVVTPVSYLFKPA